MLTIALACFLVLSFVANYILCLSWMHERKETELFLQHQKIKRCFAQLKEYHMERCAKRSFALIVSLTQKTFKRREQEVRRYLADTYTMARAVLEENHRMVQSCFAQTRELNETVAALLLRVGNTLENAGFLEDARSMYENAERVDSLNREATECLERLRTPERAPLLS